VDKTRQAQHQSENDYAGIKRMVAHVLSTPRDQVQGQAWVASDLALSEFTAMQSPATRMVLV
jgi:hypothetical protein